MNINTDFLFGFFLAVAGCVSAANLAQKHRQAHDIIIDGTDRFKWFSSAHHFLQTTAFLTDPKELLRVKRNFLGYNGFVPLPAELKALKVKGKQLEDKLELPHYAILNYPTYAEALEVAFTVLSPAEASKLAIKNAEFFFSASLDVLSAIPDYSAFTVEQLMSASTEGKPINILLNVDSAVKTLSIPALLQVLEVAEFQPYPTQLERLKCRINDLFALASHDPRVIYQILLLFDDGSLDEFFQHSTKKSKSKKQSQESEDLIVNGLINVTKSPADHERYGKLIVASRITAFKYKLKWTDFKMVAFSYAIYTNNLMEHIFAALVKNYRSFIGRKERLFLRFHDVLLSDLKKIAQERAKLLKVCEQDESLRELLSIPLSKHLRDALANIASAPETLLADNVVISGPEQVMQWTWAYLKKSFEGDESAFPFKTKSTPEVMSLLSVVFNKSQYKRFYCGQVMEVAIDMILAGETDLEPLKQGLIEIMGDTYFKNYARISERFPNVLFEETAVQLLGLFSKNVYAAAYQLDNARSIDYYIKFLQAKRNLEMIVRTAFTPQDLLKIVNERPTEGVEVFLFVIARFPEILGSRFLRYFAQNDFMPEEIKIALTGNLVKQLDDVIEDFGNVEKNLRGLYAFSPERIFAFLNSRNFVLSAPQRFIECLNVDFFQNFDKYSPADVLRFWSMIAPFYYSSESPAFDFQIDIAEVIMNSVTDSMKLVRKELIKWIVGMEVNHLRYVFDENADLLRLVGKLSVEVDYRQQILEALNALLVIKADWKGEIEALIRFVSQGPIAPARVAFMLGLKKNQQCTELVNRLFHGRQIAANEAAQKTSQDTLQIYYEIRTIILYELEEDERAVYDLVAGTVGLESGVQLLRLGLSDESSVEYRGIIRSTSYPTWKTLVRLVQARMQLNFMEEVVTQEPALVQKLDEILAAEAAAKEQKRAEIIAKLNAARAAAESKK